MMTALEKKYESASFQPTWPADTVSHLQAGQRIMSPHSLKDKKEKHFRGNSRKAVPRAPVAVKDPCVLPSFL